MSEAEVDFLRGAFDWQYFVERIYGFGKLGEFQKEVFRTFEEKDRVVVVAPREHGKTEMVIAYVLWKVTYNEGLEIAVVSSSLEQSMALIDRIKDRITGNPYLQFLKPVKENEFVDMELEEHEEKWSARIISTTTKCKIYSKPFNSSMRGMHVDILILDDILRDDKVTEDRARYLFFNVFSNAIKNREGSKIFVIGTPITETDLFATLKENPEYTYLYYQAVITNKEGNWLRPLLPELYTLEYLRKKKRELSSEIGAWEREWMCMPVGEETSIFPFSLLKKAVDKNIKKRHPDPEHYTYFCGVDIALSKSKRADYTAFTILARNIETREVEVAEIYYRKGMTEKTILNKAKEFHKKYNFVALMIERKSISIGICDAMAEDPELASIVKFWNPSKASKEEAIGKLVSAFENEIIKIPEDEEFMRQFNSFKRTKKGNKYVLESVREHDDLVISTALAYLCSEKYNYKVELIII